VRFWHLDKGKVHRRSGTRRRTTDVGQDRYSGRIYPQRDSRLHAALVVFEKRIPGLEMMLRPAYFIQLCQSTKAPVMMTMKAKPWRSRATGSRLAK